MTTAVKLKSFSFFCYTCKRPHTYRAEDEKTALGMFRKDGHSDDKVPALAPDLGRSSRRYERAIAKHKAKEQREREEHQRANEKRRLAKEMDKGNA